METIAIDEGLPIEPLWNLGGTAPSVLVHIFCEMKDVTQTNSLLTLRSINKSTSGWLR